MIQRLAAVLLRRLLPAAAILLAGVLPLQAQLAPSLRVNEADFLDLYQQTASQPVKPEIITVLDFSGSMNAVMWHPQYYTNVDENNHLPATKDPTDSRYPVYAGSDNTWARPYVHTFSSTTGPTVNFLWLDFGDISLHTIQPNLFAGDGILIKKDGTQVVAADVTGAGLATNQVINWIRQATHVRMTMNDPRGAAARTLDLPIPWRIFDSPAAAATLPSYSTSSVADTQNSNRATEFDTGYQTTSNIYSSTDNTGGYWQYYNNRNRLTEYLPSGALGWIGHFWYQQDYLYWLYFGTDVPNGTNPTGTSPNGSYVIPDTGSKTAFANGIPCMTRYQGVKRSVIMSWLANQTKVYWAYRYLDPDDEQDNSRIITSVDPANGGQSGAGRNLRILGTATGNNPDPSVAELQGKLPADGTPLTYAMANSLAQFNASRNSVFDPPRTTDKQAAPQCQTMFLFLFTDGIANDNSGGQDVIGAGNPYPITPPTTTGCNASVGNQAITSAGISSLNPDSANFNIWTLAAVAAHGTDSSALGTAVIPMPGSYPTSAASLSRFAPFSVLSRGNGTAYSTTFNPPRRIQTFTVGVSLAGSYQETDSGKYALLLAAAAGDPSKTSWDLTKAEPYSTSNTGTYFFDARDPGVLASSLGSALQAALDISDRQNTSSPSIPFSGVSLSSQVYLGQFKPPSVSGPVWSGDLMMFPTRTVSGTTVLLDGSGNPLSYLDCSTAMWSVARDVFNVAAANVSGGGSATSGCGPSTGGTTGGSLCGPSSLAVPINWSSRRILTRLPATAAVPVPDVTPFTDADPSFSLVKPYLPSALTTDTARKALVNYVRGADNASTASPKANRNDIMGDIVNSVPATLEYSWAGVTFRNGLPTAVQTALTGHSNAHLRIIFVGTNQGLLHAFAEASWPVSSTNAGGQTVSVNNAVVGELWAFLPTDFLPYLDYLQNNANTHRYMVDGAPLVYTLDLPDSTAVTGNGKVDASEKAMVVFGLRKGGRSYYALDVHDPTDPHMVWALNPDESATIPDGRVLTGSASSVRTLVSRMGYSTSALNKGRVLFNSKVRDVLFLGGGLSSTALEANFSNNALGRSLLSLDVQTGEILRSWDLLSLSGLAKTVVGPVSAGAVPARVFLNSDLHQRAYFPDLFGGIWAVGSGKTNTADPRKDFRTDSSELDKWVDNLAAPSLRRIYQDSSANGIITTLPAAFLLADFPVASSSPTNAVHPTTMGLAFVSGNRNNPLDYYANGVTVPSQHRFNVIFDRQDSRITGVDSTPISTATMTNFSSSTDPAAAALNPSQPTYYLKSNYGYYVNFPAATAVTSGGATTYHIPKGISEPAVLAYAAFYSYFTPTAAEPCKGGQGNTTSLAICNVINPIVDSSGVAGSTCASGVRTVWPGVASNFSALGTTAVIQAGMVTLTSPSPTGENSTIGLQTLSGNTSENYPKMRTWRTVRIP